MGYSADAELFYGFAFDVESGMTHPPAWTGEGRYGPEVREEKIPADVLEAYRTGPWYEEDDDELDEGYLTLDQLYGMLEKMIELRGLKDVLEVSTHGVDEFSAPVVYLKNFRMMFSQCSVTTLTADELEHPKSRLRDPLLALAHELGIPDERIGWNVVVSYG